MWKNLRDLSREDYETAMRKYEAFAKANGRTVDPAMSYDDMRAKVAVE